MHQNRTIYDYSVYLIQADLVRNLPKALLGFSDFSDIVNKHLLGHRG